MAKDFWVDYDDPPFPAIRHWSHPRFDPNYNDLVTLTQARKEIKEKCRQERQHWLAVMHRQVSLSGQTIERDAQAARKPQPSFRELEAEELKVLMGETDA